jgi:cytochrome c553
MARDRCNVAVTRSVRRSHLLLATMGIVTANFFTTTLADPPHPAETLTDACAGCHGIDGRSRGAIPSLAGIERSRFLTLMKAYRDNSVDNTIMHRFARSYSDAEFEAMADFFSAKLHK